jgi:hypothetical protein
MDDLPPKVLYYLCQEEIESNLEASETQRAAIEAFEKRKLDMAYYTKLESSSKKKPA